MTENQAEFRAPPPDRWGRYPTVGDSAPPRTSTVPPAPALEPGGARWAEHATAGWTGPSLGVAATLLAMVVLELIVSSGGTGTRPFLFFVALAMLALWRPEWRYFWVGLALVAVAVPEMGARADVPIPLIIVERLLGAIAIWLMASVAVERRQASAALRDREEYYRLLVETTDVVHWEKEVETGRITYVGPRAERLLGIPREEWYQPGFWEDHLHHDDRAWVLEASTAAARRLENFEAEYRMIGQDGHIRWVREIASPDPSLNGASSGGETSVAGGGSRARRTRGFLIDITASKRAEERTHSIIATAMDGFAMIDGEGRFVEVNAAFCRIVGFSRPELIGRRLSEFEVPPPAGTHSSSSEHQRIETRLRRRDGTLIDVEVSISSIDAEGEETIVSFYRDITERKRSETALKEREEVLRLFIDHAPASVAMFDRQMRYIAVSRRWVTDYGLGKADLIGKSHYEVFPEIPEHWKRIHERCLEGAVERCDEDSFVRTDGHVEWLRWEIHPWHDEAGQIGGIVMFTEVITERKRTEERFRRYFELPLIGAAITAPDKGWLEVNDSLCALLGYSREELERLTWAELTHPDDLAADVAQFNRVIAGEFDGYSLEKRFLKKGGEPVPASIAVHCVRDAAGAVEYFVALIQDLTARKAAEAAQRESELRFRAIFDQTFELLGLALPNGTIVEINQSALDFTGRRRDEIVGKPLWEVDGLAQTPEFIERFRGAVQAAAAGDFVRYEAGFKGKEGVAAVIDLSIKPVRDLVGKVALLIIEARDVTLPKRVEKESRRLEARIQHAQKLESLGVLAGGIAHDFNNLLMGILGHAGLALMDLPTESPARQSVQQVEVAAQRAAELTNQMLAYSGKGKFVVESLHLSQLVREMTHLLDTVISKRATLKLDLPDQLPAVHGDASQLRQVVMNLITNGSDALGDKNGILSIRTGTTRIDADEWSAPYPEQELPAGDYVYLEVSDSGIGMDNETKAKIFDPFFTTKFTGRGLGLAAVLGIVRGHHGAIRVYSEKGRGTTFKVLLPSSAEELAPALDPDHSLANWRGGGTVLVVDDEETVLSVARRTLGKFGFEVLVARDGREGVESYRTHAADIVAVLLDMTMPHMDGVEAFREIRRIRRDARVILTSGYTEQEAVERFSGKGLAGFIQKPYRPLALIDKLRDLLEG